MKITLNGEGLLRQSLSQLRECGRGKHECVVIWLGPRDSDNVTRVVHPKHTSDRRGYQIDSAWVGELYEELAAQGERIVAQVHTHPGRAFHSRTDDASPIARETGLFSLVIPNHAREPIDQRGWYLAQLKADGSWRETEWKETPA